MCMSVLTGVDNSRAVVRALAFCQCHPTETEPLYPLTLPNSCRHRKYPLALVGWLIVFAGTLFQY